MTCTLQYYASRKGAPILGKLQYSGNGPRKEFRPHDSIDSLRDSCDRANNRLLKRSTEDRHSVTLLEKTQGDATLGRMSWPYQPDDLRGVVVNSRFGVEQGVTDKGTPKVRPVDDFSASGVNKCCEPTERLQHDGVDSLFQLTKLFREKVGVVPSLFKADIDAASHRVPLDPAHRWAATIAFRVKGRWACAEHWAVPFGAIGSVFAWDRVGALLAHIGRKLLRLPLLRSAPVDNTTKKKKVCCMCATGTLMTTSGVCSQSVWTMACTVSRDWFPCYLVTERCRPTSWCVGCRCASLAWMSPYAVKVCYRSVIVRMCLRKCMYALHRDELQTQT